MKTTVRRPVSTETIQGLARQLADYRLGGCHSGVANRIQSDVRKVAGRHGQSYSELWSEVHRVAYEIIDAR